MIELIIFLNLSKVKLNNGKEDIINYKEKYQISDLFNNKKQIYKIDLMIKLKLDNKCNFY